jgi:hypothetical protein
MKPEYRLDNPSSNSIDTMIREMDYLYKNENFLPSKCVYQWILSSDG